MSRGGRPPRAGAWALTCWDVMPRSCRPWRLWRPQLSALTSFSASVPKQDLFGVTMDRAMRVDTAPPLPLWGPNISLPGLSSQPHPRRSLTPPHLGAWGQGVKCQADPIEKVMVSPPYRVCPHLDQEAQDL